MISSVVDSIMLETVPDETEPEEWNLERTRLLLGELSGVGFDLSPLKEMASPEEVREAAVSMVLDYYAMKREKIGLELSDQLEKRAVLGSIDSMWREHLYGIDHLKSGINLRAYAQRDPLVEFKKEAFGLFEELLGRIDRLASRQVLSLWPRDAVKDLPESQRVKGSAIHPGASLPAAQARAAAAGAGTGGRRPAKQETVVREDPKVGRNDPCPCGSGKKYKKCCGR